MAVGMASPSNKVCCAGGYLLHVRRCWGESLEALKGGESDQGICLYIEFDRAWVCP